MKLHKGIALGLSALLTLSLAACAKPDDANTSSSANPDTASSATNDASNANNVASSDSGSDATTSSGDYRVYMPQTITEESGQQAISMAEKAVALLKANDVEGAYALWDSRLQEQGTAEYVQEQWDAMVEQTGALKDIVSMQVTEEQGYITVVTLIDAENGQMQLTTATETNGDAFLGFLFAPLTNSETIELALPNNVKETDVTVDAGTGYPLEGNLTMPVTASTGAKVPGVVLVHGSGPCDRNEAAHAYLPFRDIAYGLGEQGIAVLRYDKRTKIYPSSDYSTVETETIEDAIAAANLLRQQEGVDPENVWIVGHSMGAMLAPRIDKEGGDFAGMVLIASSPYTMADVAMHQARASIDAQEAAGTDMATAETAYNQSVADWESITDTTAEADARAKDIFGMNGYYLQDFAKFDQLSLLKELKKQTLIMQGEADIQVTMETDYAQYEKEVGGESWATLVSYPGLNHFFAPGSGDILKAPEEYQTAALFDSTAIKDIAAFILSSDTSA